MFNNNDLCFHLYFLEMFICVHIYFQISKTDVFTIYPGLGHIVTKVQICLR